MNAFSLRSRFLFLRVASVIVALALPRGVTAGGAGVFTPLVSHELGSNFFLFENVGNWTGGIVGSNFNFSHALTADQVLLFFQDHTTVEDEGLTFSLQGPHLFTLRGLGNKTLTLNGGIEVTSDNVASVTIGATGDHLHLDLKMTGAGAFSVAAGKLLTVVNSISDIEGGYTLTKTGDGTLVLSGESTYGGGTTITAGTIETTVKDALPTLREIEVEVEATLTLGEDQTLAGLIGGGAVQIGDGKKLTLDVAQHAEWDFSGVISGEGGKLVKDGLGTQKLSGEHTSTYGGGTEIKAGTLKVIAANVLPTSGAVTIAGGGVLSVGADQTIGALSGSSGSSVRFEEDVASFLPPNFKLTVNGATSTTFAGTISGNGSLVKEGSGTLTLTGTNTYDGSTTVSGGALQLGSGDVDGVIATAVSIGSDASLIFNPHTNTRFDEVISGDGSVTKNGSPTLTLGAVNTYTGGTTINAGKLIVSNPVDQAGDSGTGSGLVTIGNGAVLEIGDHTTADKGSVAGAIANSGTLYFNRPGSMTHASVISGGGNVSVETGSVSLTGANTYNGGTTIKDGATMALDNASGQTLATGADVTLIGTGRLDVNQNQEMRGLISTSATSSAVIASGKTLTINLPDASDEDHTAATFAGSISGDGTLATAGAGTFTLTGTNAYKGGTKIEGGTLAISSDGNLGAVPGSATPGILMLNGGVLKTTATLTLDSKRGVSLGANGGEIKVETGTTLTYGGIIAGTTLKKSGAGTLALSGANSYSGSTSINAGTLKITGSTDVLPTSTELNMAANTTFDVRTNQTIRRFVSTVASSSIVIEASKVLDINLNTNSEFKGVISGGGGLHLSGNEVQDWVLTLANDNTYSGGTEIHAHTVLKLGDGGTTGMIAGNVTNNGMLSFNRSNAVTFNGVISGTGSVQKMAGSSSLTLTAANTYSGGTNIYGGQLFANNSSGSATGTGAVNVFSGAVFGGNGSITGALNVNSGGTVSPGLSLGSPATLQVKSATFAAGGKFDFQINDADGDPGTDYSLLSISQALTLGANSEEKFTVYLYSLNGSSLGALAGFNPTLEYQWQFVSAGSFSGSFNADAFHVDTANFANTFNGTFGVTFQGNNLFVSYTPAAIPEPSTWALLALGLGAVWIAMRRGRRVAGGK